MSARLGTKVGTADGVKVGNDDDGFKVGVAGLTVGILKSNSIVPTDGCDVGEVGIADGTPLGTPVGILEGQPDGVPLGTLDGTPEGLDGAPVGFADGIILGCPVGIPDGSRKVGSDVGKSIFVQEHVQMPSPTGYAGLSS